MVYLLGPETLLRTVKTFTAVNHWGSEQNSGLVPAVPTGVFLTVTRNPGAFINLVYLLIYLFL